MKMILESSESIGEERVSGDEEKDESDCEEMNPLLQDILRYRLLYAQQQARSLEHPNKQRIKNMWSLLKNIGETLKLLAPVALLAVICGRDSPVIKFFNQFDRALRNALFPPPNQTDEVLAWLKELLADNKRLTSLNVLWMDSSVMCELVNSVIPGACEGHKDVGKSDFSHSQRLVEQYLGVSPIFSPEDLSEKTLNPYQEYRLCHYLCRIKEAISQMSPPVSRAGTPLLNIQAYTFDYVARGMGIITAYKDKQASFYIYPTAQQSLDPGDISVQIRGPGICYGSAIVPVIYGRTHIIRNVIFNLEKKPSVSHLPLPLTQGASYFRNYNSDIQTKYYIPKIKNDIDVKIIMKNDKTKVVYVPTITGRYEISLISKGCHLIGSPYSIQVDVSDKDDSYSQSDDDEESFENTVKYNKKVIFSVVDFVTEKMLLTEDGRLEKLTNAQAETLTRSGASVQELTNKYLELSKKLNGKQSPDVVIETEKEYKKKRRVEHFKHTVRQVIFMLKVCQQFQMNVVDVNAKKWQQNANHPDVVNSTMNDSSFEDLKMNVTPRKVRYNKKSNANSLREKFKRGHSSFNDTVDINKPDESDICDVGCICNSPTKSNIIPSTDRESSSGLSDLNSTFDDTHSILYRTSASIDIIISSFDDEDPLPLDSLTPINELPILQELPERPKTPVCKVLDSPEDDVEEEVDMSTIERVKNQIELKRDFCVKLFTHSDSDSLDLDTGQNFISEGERMSPSIDFHIGAAVTPTKMFHNPNIDADMDSIILASNLEEALVKYDLKVQNSLKYQGECSSTENNTSDFMSPGKHTPFEDMTDSEILKMYEDVFNDNQYGKENKSTNERETNSSNEFNVQKGGVNIIRKTNTGNVTIAQDSFSSNGDNNESLFSSFNQSVETWDSAYVSIDEINSSPDTNSSPRAQYSPKSKLWAIEEANHETTPTPTNQLLNNIGPAEWEIWRNRLENEMQKEKEFNQTCNDLKNNLHSKSLRLFTKNNISIIDEQCNDEAIHTTLQTTVKQLADRTEHDNEIDKYDFSASDGTADVNTSISYSTISTIQSQISELNRKISNHNTQITEKANEEDLDNMFDSPFGNKNDRKSITRLKVSNIVSEKKDYWDKKIRTLQCKEEKKHVLHSRKKNLVIKRSDSLGKKKGKQIAKSQNMAEIWKNTFEPPSANAKDSNSNHSLVSRWKEYWNERVNNEHSAQDNELSRIRRNTLENINNLLKDKNYSTTLLDSSIGQNKQNVADIHAIKKIKNLPNNVIQKTNLYEKNSKINNKYQPTPINLQCITKRIDKFLETSFSPKMDENLDDETRFSSPESVFEGIVSINVNKFDGNNNHMNNDKIVKIEKNNTKLSIIWNDCISQKRIDALEQISASTTPDINFYDVKKDCEAIENELNINTSHIKSIYEMENLTSFPTVAKIKADIESLSDKSKEQTRTNFLYQRSKTLDAITMEQISTLKKSTSMTKIQDLDADGSSEMKNRYEIVGASNMTELKRAFEPVNSDKKINLNISAESIPSLINRKLNLEKHLQKLQQRTAIHNTSNCQDKYNYNLQIVEPSSIDATIGSIEDISLFKPVSDIVKAFENNLSPSQNEHKLPEIKLTNYEDYSDKSSALVAEKGEGNMECEKHYLEQDHSFVNDKHMSLTYPSGVEDFDDEPDKCEEIIQKTDLDQVKEDFEYKNRFKEAKNFFQKLDKKLTIIKTITTVSKNVESLDIVVTTSESIVNKEDDIVTENHVKPSRKEPIKSLTSPIFDKEHDKPKRTSSQVSSPPRLRKISEKFMVDGLFHDVIGDSNTIGNGFKGIPHKEAVLAAFRSMESVSQLSPYELSISQMEDFAKNNGIVNAQTYHSDFPYLPTTEPNKYRSRYDAIASGFIKRSQLLNTQKMRRRYSEPARPRMYLDFVQDV